MLVHKINISFANMMQEFCEREFYTRVIDFFVFMQSRQRNIIWYNPLFPQNVQTNVGKSFLRTVKRSFPPGHPLHKIFNQNTLKLSYSCMPNVRNIIDNHNKKNQQNAKTDDTEQREKLTKSCNCRKPAECPINGNCLQKSVIYQATVTNKSDGSKETYIGLTKNEFKERFNRHKSTFKNVSKRYSTQLSKHVWNPATKTLTSKSIGPSSGKASRTATNPENAASANSKSITSSANLNLEL